MPLQSQLFKGDRALEACAVQDSAHIQLGAFGQHVGKIQTALFLLDRLDINAGELSATRYGQSTADAVVSFKKKRGIINRSYQTQVDNIVGKMTMAALDKEILAQENAAPSGKTCILVSATPSDVFGGLVVGDSFAVTGPAGGRSDADVMAAALRASRSTVRSARDKLFDLANVIRQNKPLTPALAKIFGVATKWLKLPASQQAALPHLDAATNLMLRNISVKTSTFTEVQLTRVAATTFHAESNISAPDLGVRCGTPFFTVDGPNCRRDVITHELFHLVGVGHGGSPGDTVRRNVTTPALALDSADNLAQMVAELETPGGRTDACARRRE
jgi:hypothetical protein